MGSYWTLSSGPPSPKRNHQSDEGFIEETNRRGWMKRSHVEGVGELEKVEVHPAFDTILSTKTLKRKGGDGTRP